MFKNAYKCGFCRTPLKPVPFLELGLMRGILAIGGIRMHECVHCFAAKYRPGFPISLPERRAAPNSQSTDRS